jgi:hypothetical protein
MSSRLRSRLTYANVMSTVAVFFAVGGGTAVALTGSNTVFSDDIKDGEVKNPDIAVKSIGGGKLVDNAIGPPKVVPNSLDAGRLAPNAVGGSELSGDAVSGPKVASDSMKGEDVDESSLGEAGVKTTPTYEVNATGSIAAGQTTKTVTAVCDVGDRTQSGGHINLSDGAEVEDDALGDERDWRVQINGPSGNSVTTRLRCYDFPPLR